MGNHKNMFKIGDRVRVKSVEEMIRTYDLGFTASEITTNPVVCEFISPTVGFVSSMWKECGREDVVRKVEHDGGSYFYRLEHMSWAFDEGMLEIAICGKELETFGEDACEIDAFLNTLIEG